MHTEFLAATLRPTLMLHVDLLFRDCTLAYSFATLRTALSPVRFDPLSNRALTHLLCQKARVQPSFSLRLDPVSRPSFSLRLDPVSRPSFSLRLDPVSRPSFSLRLDPVSRPSFSLRLDPVSRPSFSLRLDPVSRPPPSCATWCTRRAASRAGSSWACTAAGRGRAPRRPSPPPATPSPRSPSAAPRCSASGGTAPAGWRPARLQTRAAG